MSSPGIRSVKYSNKKTSDIEGSKGKKLGKLMTDMSATLTSESDDEIMEESSDNSRSSIIKQLTRKSLLTRRLTRQMTKKQLLQVANIPNIQDMTEQQIMKHVSLDMKIRKCSNPKRFNFKAKRYTINEKEYKEFAMWKEQNQFQKYFKNKNNRGNWSMYQMEKILNKHYQKKTSKKTQTDGWTMPADLVEDDLHLFDSDNIQVTFNRDEFEVPAS
jgi:hypothetical protein